MAVKNSNSLPSEDVGFLVEKPQLKFDIREVDGKQFLVHKVLLNDSLSMISLKFNVSQ
jgi:hypothetical protein